MNLFPEPEMPLTRCQALTTSLLLGLGAGGCADIRGEAPAQWRPDQARACELSPVGTSDPGLQFSQVESVDIDSRGRIYVGDRLRHHVVVLSPKGRLIRTIGRPGSGPGEFKAVRNVQVLPGDSLLVYDIEHYRVSIYPPESGAAAYELNVARASRGTPPNRVEKLPGEHAFFATHRQPFSVGEDSRSDYVRTQAVRIMEWDGRTRRDSVLVVPAPQPLIARTSQGVAATANPFGRPGMIHLGADRRLYYGRGDSLAIDVYSLDGQRVGGISRPYVGPPILPAEIEEAGEGLDNVLKQALREQAPERWPAFRTFVVDENGHVWIGLLSSKGEPVRWIRFDAQGHEVCSTMLPGNIDLRLARGSRLYGVETDELDVPRIVIYGTGERTGEKALR